MEALIKPESGLMIWTIAIFVLLVLILSRTAWAPLIKAVEERERALRHDREAAEKARVEAEKIRTELETRLAQLKAEVDARLAESREEGARERDRIIEAAARSAAAMAESARRELETQKNELARELRTQVAEIAILAAEKVLLKAVDHKSNAELVDRFLKELETKDASFKL